MNPYLATKNNRGTLRKSYREPLNYCSSAAAMLSCRVIRYISVDNFQLHVVAILVV